MDPNSALTVSIASLAVVLNALPSVLLMEGPLACLASAQSMAQVTSASAGPWQWRGGVAEPSLRIRPIWGTRQPTVTQNFSIG
jgi:hypothetical protein